MKVSNSIRGSFLFVICALFMGFVSTVHTTDLTVTGKDPYIEVHGPSIAYVPITAKYVKYDGIIKKISRFSAALSTGEEDCQCPKCCNGHCYIIIYTNIISPAGPIMILAILWLEC